MLAYLVERQRWQQNLIYGCSNANESKKKESKNETKRKIAMFDYILFNSSKSMTLLVRSLNHIASFAFVDLILFELLLPFECCVDLLYLPQDCIVINSWEKWDWNIYCVHILPRGWKW